MICIWLEMRICHCIYMLIVKLSLLCFIWRRIFLPFFSLSFFLYCVCVFASSIYLFKSRSQFIEGRGNGLPRCTGKNLAIVQKKYRSRWSDSFVHTVYCISLSPTLSLSSLFREDEYLPLHWQRTHGKRKCKCLQAEQWAVGLVYRINISLSLYNNLQLCFCYAVLCFSFSLFWFELL